MNKILDCYIDVLKFQKKYSGNTTENYKKDIDNYINYLNVNKIEGKTITYQEIQDYLLFLYNNKYSKSTINRMLSSLRGFYKYMCEEKYIESNPFDTVSSLKKDKKLPNYLYTNEVEELLNVEENDNAINQRNELIVELLYDTGLRVSELVSIKISDINFSSKTIKTLGKGKKARIVMFGEYGEEKLKKYINDGRRQLISNSSGDYLFLNSRGGALTSRSVRNILNLQTSKSRINSHVTPHTLRHTFATHLLNEGAELTTVKELLGHKNLSTTSIYTHLSKEHLRNVYLSSHPRSKK